MIKLFLKRSESEPIRESYFRDIAYFMADRHLYQKRYSWGRIQEDKSEKITLPNAEYAIIRELLNEVAFHKDCHIKQSNSSQSELWLDFQLHLMNGTMLAEQRYLAEQSFLRAHHPSIVTLWQLLGQFFNNKPFTAEEPVHATPGFSFELEINEYFSADKSKLYSRTYRFRANAPKLDADYFL